jgi:16S rRNA (guanine1207-N2)-methyltransferase
MSDHYFASSPPVASRRATVRLVLPDLTADLVTDRGVFAADAVDTGTRVLLLEAPPPSPTGDLLDLGCGYGPIALTMARRAPGARIWAVDVNERARALCAENTVGSNVHVVEPDAVPDEVRFETIWSNPPIRIGKHALHALLTRWLGRLSETGTAVLVVHKHLGADSLAHWLTEHDWTVRRRGSRQGFRILEVTR